MKFTLDLDFDDIISSDDDDVAGDAPKPFFKRSCGFSLLPGQGCHQGFAQGGSALIISSLLRCRILVYNFCWSNGYAGLYVFWMLFLWVDWIFVELDASNIKHNLVELHFILFKTCIVVRIHVLLCLRHERLFSFSFLVMIAVAKQQQQGINDVFTDDLLLEIFFRLPCKLAIQCKSVCTRWNALISSPCLVRGLIAHHYQLQLGWNNSQQGLMIQGFGKQLLMIRYHPEFPLSAPLSLAFLPCFQGEESRGAIVSSCNDLLLCCSDLRTCTDGEVVFYVCNPFTRQWVATPPIPGFSGLFFGMAPIGFICDPFYRLDDQGCVILNPICRFRIFLPYRTTTMSDMNFDMAIFSSETGEWSNIKASRQRIFRRGATYGFTPVVEHNGRLYFQAGMDIVAYDPSSCKICCDIDLPEDSELDKSPPEGLSCSRGSLWMCQWHKWARTLRVWRLKEEHESSSSSDDPTVQYWSLEREVNLSMCTGLSEDFIRSARVLGLHPDDPDIILLSFAFTGVNVSWNLRTGATEFFSSCKSNYYTTWVDSFFLEVPVWPTPVSLTTTN